MSKRFLFLLPILSVCSLSAQTPQTQPLQVSADNYVNPLFRHVDVGITAGTLGVGLEVAAPLTNFMDVRTGFTYMPHFEAKMDFGIDVYNQDGTPNVSRRQKMLDMMKQVTGTEVDNEVDMIGEPRFNNFKFLLDIKPFRNKNWSFTAGFYIGGRNIAKAYNTTEDMPSLFAVSMFNHVWEVYKNSEPWYVLNDVTVYVWPEIGERLNNMGEMGIHVGNYTHDVLYSENVYNVEYEVIDGVAYEPGTRIVHAANDPNDPLHRAGDPYLMQPDEASMAKARIRVNSFRPYLGFGYGGRLSKRSDNYWVHLECGALFWGGTPQIITHDGTDLSKDVENISGKVGRYVDFFSAFKVFPVLNFRISRRF